MRLQGQPYPDLYSWTNPLCVLVHKLIDEITGVGLKLIGEITGATLSRSTSWTIKHDLAMYSSYIVTPDVMAYDSSMYMMHEDK